MIVHRLLPLTAALLLAAFVPVPTAAAAERTATAADGTHPKSGYYRRGPKVKGYVARRGKGGYSYTAADTINTYGDSRTRYGSTSFYRFWGTDRQSSSGPFDHGFFFDSGIAPRGGDSPYMN
jgi:hypothetical protein